jgi:hypothetical protein
MCVYINTMYLRTCVCGVYVRTMYACKYVQIYVYVRTMLSGGPVLNYLLRIRLSGPSNYAHKR